MLELSLEPYVSDLVLKTTLKIIVHFNNEKKKMLSTCQDQFHSIVVGKYAYLDAKSESRYMGFLYGTYMGHLYV